MIIKVKGCLAMLLMLFLMGCGNKGDLYVPEESEPNSEVAKNEVQSEVPNQDRIRQ